MDKNKLTSKLAHWFYIKRKRKDGQHLNDWLKAERIVKRIFRFKDGFFKLLRHPLVIIFFTAVAILIIQQQFIKNEELLRKKFEVTKAVLPVYKSYYQETWNYWVAFRNKQPVDKYRADIQQIAVEAKTLGTQISILFRDRSIDDNWKLLLHIFWQANYSIAREGVSEDQLNESLDQTESLINEIVNRMYRELR